jgi:hypothetical protein
LQQVSGRLTGTNGIVCKAYKSNYGMETEDFDGCNLFNQAEEVKLELISFHKLAHYNIRAFF